MGSFIIAKQFVTMLITETIEEFRENPINERSVLTGFVFFGSLSVLGASVLKSLAVGVVVYFAVKFHIGRRSFIRLAVPVLMLAITVWIGVLPPPAELPSFVKAMAKDILSPACL